jgi:hypothetical protein
MTRPSRRSPHRATTPRCRKSSPPIPVKSPRTPPARGRRGPADASAAERADVALGASMAAQRNHPFVRAAATAGELTDQGPLYILGAVVLAGGLAARSRAGGDDRGGHVGGHRGGGRRQVADQAARPPHPPARAAGRAAVRGRGRPAGRQARAVVPVRARRVQRRGRRWPSPGTTRPPAGGGPSPPSRWPSPGSPAGPTGRSTWRPAWSSGSRPRRRRPGGPRGRATRSRRGGAGARRP